jgi:uncharacterized protein (TIGR03083 family)
VTPEEYVGLLRADGEALAVAAAGALERAVPSCPGWTVADLVAHTGAVHRDKAAIVRHGGTERPPRDEMEAPGGAALLDWYREGLHDLVDLLGATDPEQPAWSWSGDTRVAFWQRRMAHETAIHRWDAQAAVRTPWPITPSAFAADGVAEVLDIWLEGVDGAPYPGPDGTLHVHATDTAGEWLVTLAAGREPEVAAGHAKADAALRGPASDLDLVLWARVTSATVERFGDDRLLDAFLGWIDRS